MKKIVLKVTIACEKCRSLVLTTVAKIEGIKSLSIDADNGILTVVGVVDPVCIVNTLRKKKRGAVLISVGPEDTKKEVKEDKKNDPCQGLAECCKLCVRGSHWPGPVVFIEEYQGCIIS